MEKISISPFVRDKLDELILTLSKDDYFSYIENSEAYVSAIYGFLYTIPELKHHPTGTTRYGRWYCRYKPNKQTTWFATFDKEHDFYIVKNVINNHTKDYLDFIRIINEKE